MRIKNIQVNKLFGMFDHNIPLRLDDRITIIHGPNGYGKTAILFLVQSLLGNNRSKLRQIPFEKFIVTFDDGKVLSVSKKIHKRVKHSTEEEGTATHIHYCLTTPGARDEDFDYEFSSLREELGFPLELIDRHIDELDRIGPERWMELTTGRRLGLDDVLDIYGEMLPIRHKKERKIPEWLSTLFCNYNVRLIQAQRLLNLYEGRKSRRDYSSLQPAVATYARELAADIQKIQAKYGTFSQQLDSTFPTRVIDPSISFTLSIEELKTKLQDLEKKRQRIVSAGLLTTEQSNAQLFDPQRTIDEPTKNILSLYSQDVESKLSILDPLTEKIELFKEILNKRFSYKKLDVESREGFIITTSRGLHLSPVDLSSGEQHEIVLFYELLFKTDDNSLILIDEPELSLHVAWQVEFLNDLAKVVKLSPFDAILATHSPQIINDRWDLTEELKGPPNAQISQL